jgi:hypothetical protein
MSWCLVKGIGVSYRLVPTNIISKLVLNRGDRCLLQFGACKDCESRFVPTSCYKEFFLFLFSPIWISTLNIFVWWIICLNVYVSLIFYDW